MSDTLYSDIRTALTKRLKTITGLPEVAWENATYTPTADVAYLRPIVLWGEPSQAELGVDGRNWEIGIYQITCVYPLDQGIGPINTILGKLKECFKRGTELTYNGVLVKIRKVYPSPSPNPASPAGYEIPFSVAFYCQAAN